MTVPSNERRFEPRIAERAAILAATSRLDVGRLKLRTLNAEFRRVALLWLLDSAWKTNPRIPRAVASAFRDTARRGKQRAIDLIQGEELRRGSHRPPTTNPFEPARGDTSAGLPLHIVHLLDLVHDAYGLRWNASLPKGVEVAPRSVLADGSLSLHRRFVVYKRAVGGTLGGRPRSADDPDNPMRLAIRSVLRGFTLSERVKLLAPANRRALWHLVTERCRWILYEPGTAKRRKFGYVSFSRIVEQIHIEFESATGRISRTLREDALNLPGRAFL